MAEKLASSHPAIPERNVDVSHIVLNWNNGDQPYVVNLEKQILPNDERSDRIVSWKKVSHTITALDRLPKVRYIVPRHQPDMTQLDTILLLTLAAKH